MYEPHRPYPLAALLVLCLALCADPALANGATGGWGEGAGPAKPDNPKPPAPQPTSGYQYGTKCYGSVPAACKARQFDKNIKPELDFVSVGDIVGNVYHVCNMVIRGTNQSSSIYISKCTRPSEGFDKDPDAPPEPPKPPESGGGGDFGGGGASGDWEEDPKKPDEDKEDPKEDPKNPDPDFGDVGDIPTPPVPPPAPPASGPNVNVGVGVNVPEPCTGAAAGTVGCMKPGEPTGEKPKPKDVNVPKQLEKPVSHIKGCPDPKYFDLWEERYELSYDQFCAQAPLIRPYVIFSATLAAFFITLSAFRRK